MIQEMQFEGRNAKVVQHQNERTYIFFLHLIIHFHLFRRNEFGDLQIGRRLVKNIHG